MPLFAMLSPCNMLFGSSKHCNLMLFLPCPVISAKSVKLFLFAIFPCHFEDVVVIFADSSVFMFCHALPINHVHVICFHFEVV